MPNPLISLILPTKNSLPHLKNAIEAIKQQTYRNFEVIIQDGGSSDGTLEYVHSIKDLPKLKVYSEPDKGIGQAYNRGLSKSEGDFVCLAASDERLFPYSLELGLSWFNENPTAAVIYGGSNIIDDSGKILQTFLPPPFIFSKIIKCESVPPCGLQHNK